MRAAQYSFVLIARALGLEPLEYVGVQPQDFAATFPRKRQHPMHLMRPGWACRPARALPSSAGRRPPQRGVRRPIKSALSENREGGFNCFLRRVICAVLDP